jgi:adenosylmethionine-8-amino-7-oxononanoate aminotransferase
MFGAQKYGYQPDIITSAKGITSGYSPLGAAIISDAVFEPFAHGTTAFPHGYTFGGHPVSCAVALANLDLFDREDLLGNVLRQENAFRRTMEKLYDLPIVGDVRGDGYLLWSRVGEGQGDQADPGRSRSGTGIARLHRKCDVRERPLLPD